jgi:hypothetical protein
MSFLYLVSWDEYKSVVRDNVSAGITVDTMFSKRTKMDSAAKTAKTLLEGVAKKYEVDYKELVRALMEKF